MPHTQHNPEDKATASVATAHAKAMDAKEAVFRAQDALSRAWSVWAEDEQAAFDANDPERKRVSRRVKSRLETVERKLAKVRAELEALDNFMRDAFRTSGVAP